MAEEKASAVAVAAKREVVHADSLSDITRIRSIAGMANDVERWAVEIILPPKLQYAIKGKSTKNENAPQGQQWSTDYTFQPKAEAYDVLNRVMGVQLHVPPFVNDFDGKQVPNPIHTRDEVYVRMVGIGYNDLGQQLVIPADIGINFIDVWQADRLKRKSKKLVRDADGEPVIDPETQMPKFTLTDEDEFASMELRYNLRQFGERRAESICKARILKTFSAIRTLYVEQDWPHFDPPKAHAVGVVVVGFKDMMKADERLARAKATAADVFGSPIQRDDPKLGELDMDEALEAEFTEAAEEDTSAARAATAPPKVTTVQGEDSRARSDETEAVAIKAQPTVLPGESIATEKCLEVPKDPDFGTLPCTKRKSHEGSHVSATGDIWPDGH